MSKIDGGHHKTFHTRTHTKVSGHNQLSLTIRSAIFSQLTGARISVQEEKQNVGRQTGRLGSKHADMF